MADWASSLSYQDLLINFKHALDRALSGHPPPCVPLDVNVTLALLDVAHAVRQGRPAHDLVFRACGQFSSRAAEFRVQTRRVEAAHRRSHNASLRRKRAKTGWSKQSSLPSPVPRHNRAVNE